MSASSSGSALSLKLALAALLLLLIVGGIWLVGGGGEDPGSQSPLPPERLNGGYQEGDFYRTIVNTSVQGKVEDEDWGVNKKGSLLYLGEVDILREVTSKSDTGITIDLTFRKAKDLQIGIKLTDVLLDLPQEVGNILYWSTVVAPLPPWTDRVGNLLEKEWVRGMLIDVAREGLRKASGKELEDVLGLIEPSVEFLDGKGGTYNYVPGEGLTEFESRGELSMDQETRLEEFSIFAESYIFPAPEGDGPDEWDVNVRDIAHLIVPSSNLEVQGTLRVARRERDGEIQRLEIVKGVIEFVGGETSSETLGRWAARGDLFFDLGQKTVVEGLLSGDLDLVRRSTDHILFEKRWAVKPKYKVRIFGFRTKDKKMAREDVLPRKVSHTAP